MTTTVKALKVTRRQAAYKIVGTGLGNVSIYDALYGDQTIDAANVKLTITSLAYDVGNSANITRNGNVIFNMTAGQTEFNFTEHLGIVFDEDAKSNVTVNLGATPGTVILQFSKEAGYTDPDRQILQPMDR